MDRPPLMMRPLKQGEYIRNPDGSVSTERTITYQLDDGRWVNSPTLFMTPSGVRSFSEQPEVAEMIAKRLMLEYGFDFPTFNSLEEAEAAAKARSEAGGAFSSGVFSNPNGIPVWSGGNR